MKFVLAALIGITGAYIGQQKVDTTFAAWCWGAGTGTLLMAYWDFVGR